MFLREIRFHGRGGQGAVTAAQILADAVFREGKYSQAFPFFGAERRGAPVMAFARIDDRPIRVRSHVYEPDYVVVLDPTLLEVVKVTEGMREGGILIVNTERNPEDIACETCSKVATVDATTIALDILGVPITNTAILGAFAKATGEVKIETVLDSIRRMSPARPEENAKAAERAYSETKVLEV